MPEQSNPTGAVFISYGSQDAEAAGRISEALRAAGIEVWLDQSTLRAGDAWDAKIRKQINECALFLPVISAHTNARSEGYFRREWKLATRRLLDMADDVAFLVPVVIDETGEADARVPEEFLRAHWTWLLGGETPPAFALRVRQLLGGDRAPVHNAPSGVIREIEPSVRRAVPPRPRPWYAGDRGKHRARSVGLAVIALLLVLGGGVFWYYERASEMAMVASTPPVNAVATATDRSIAVLPFVNMSLDKDQEYFADGIAEELLNLLAKIPELRVISRSSAFSFKGQNLEMSEIASRLNVSHILEGSVRKSGNQVRITAQLIEARTDTHLWSQTWDRTLDDIFVVQDEIAGAVVAHLKVALLQAASKAKAVDPKSYALSLQARQASRQRTPEGIDQSIALYQQALVVDASHAAAWVGLAANYLVQANKGLRSVDESYRLAREAATKALAIDQDDALALAVLSKIAGDYDGDLAAAARYLEHALALDPTNPDVIGGAANLAQNLDRMEMAVALDEYLVVRDPLNPTGHASLGYDYIRTGRLDAGISSYRTALSLNPGRIGTQYNIGEALLRKGESKAAFEEMQKEPSDSWRLMGLSMAYHALGQRAKSDALLGEMIDKHGKEFAYNIAYVLAWRGDADRAFDWLDKTVAYRDTGLVEIMNDPMFANIHDDPRWLPFLRKVGKAPEQLAAIQFDVKLPK